MSETGRVAPGCGPTDPDGVQPPEGRDVIALPVIKKACPGPRSCTIERCFCWCHVSGGKR